MNNTPQTCATTSASLHPVSTGSQSHIVFVHSNDLWVVARDGGDARRLTTAIGAVVNPRLSPDGNSMAYQPNTFGDPEWRNYLGGQAQPIFMLDLRNYELKRSR